MHSWLTRASLAILAIAACSVLPDAVLGGDNAEFVTLAQVGGVAHPPGYPVFVAWLRVWSILPVAPPTSAALATLALYIAALFTLERALRAWGAHPTASLLSTLIVGACPLWFTLGTHAEVFAPLLLLAAITLLASAPSRPNLVLFALAMGLGFAHHHTLVFLLPLVVCAWQRERLALAIPVAVAAAGIPYLWLWHASALPLDAALVWRPLHSFSDLAGHILRSDYGATQLFRNATPAPPLIHIPGLMIDLADAVRVGPLVLVPFAWRSHAPKKHLWLLAVAWLLAGPVFFSRFNAAPSAFSELFTHRFVALPLLLLTPFIALGLDSAVRELPAWARISVPFLVLLVQLPRSLSETRLHHHDNVESSARHVLQTRLPNAIVIQRGDQHVFATAYLQKVQHLRNDITATGLEAFHVPEHAAHLNALTHTNAFARQHTLDAALLQLLETRRPTFVSPSLAPPLTQVVASACDTVSTIATEHLSLAACDASFYATLQLVPPIEVFPDTPDGWAALACDEVAQVFLALSQRWEDADQQWLAEQRRDDALLFAPWLLET